MSQGPFVQLTMADDTPVLLRIDDIVAVHVGPKGMGTHPRGSAVMLRGASMPKAVREEFDDVLRKIGGA